MIFVLLLVGVGFTWGQRLTANVRLSAELPTPASETQSLAEPAPEYIYFVDVEGWYRITPYETAVRSLYDLSGDTTDAIAAALPSTLGEWQQVGDDRYVGDDPAVVFYLKHPTVALQRTYRDASGQDITLVIIGNKGNDSFLLFSHTPETCYPGRLWNVIENRRESAMLDAPSRGSGIEEQPMYAQYLLTEHAPTGRKLMVLFWYLWDDPRRDSKDGVLSIRVNLFIPPDVSEKVILERAWDFVRELFPGTVPWERF